MRRLLLTISRWWTQLKKSGGDFVDIFKPRGDLELRLLYGHGPKKGEVARVIKGRNIVTSFLGSLVGPPGTTSGRDMMRRLLIPNASSTSGGFAGELSSNDNCTIQIIRLGTGTTAETSGDQELEVPIVDIGNPKVITDVVLDGSNPFVTFVAEFGTGDLNGYDISEAALESGRGDFFARKTFGAFTKTSDYSLEVRWTIRF